MDAVTLREDPSLPRNKRVFGIACGRCKRDHKACDYKRPCARCISLGAGEHCSDVPMKKLGRPQKRKGAIEKPIRRSPIVPASKLPSHSRSMLMQIERERPLSQILFELFEEVRALKETTSQLRQEQSELNQQMEKYENERQSARRKSRLPSIEMGKNGYEGLEFNFYNALSDGKSEIQEGNPFNLFEQDNIDMSFFDTFAPMSPPMKRQRTFNETRYVDRSLLSPSGYLDYIDPHVSFVVDSGSKPFLVVRPFKRCGYLQLVRVAASEQMCELLQHSREELLGYNSTVTIVPPQYRNLMSMPSAFTNADDSQSVSDILLLEPVFVNKNGDLLWTRSRMQVFRGERFVSFIIVCIDEVTMITPVHLRPLEDIQPQICPIMEEADVVGDGLFKCNNPPPDPGKCTLPHVPLECDKREPSPSEGTSESTSPFPMSMSASTSTSPLSVPLSPTDLLYNEDNDDILFPSFSLSSDSTIGTDDTDIDADLEILGLSSMPLSPLPLSYLASPPLSQTVTVPEEYPGQTPTDHYLSLAPPHGQPQQTQQQEQEEGDSTSDAPSIFAKTLTNPPPHPLWTLLCET